ncbi:MAG: MATE family efflux transporter [Oligoflexus sp.]
MLADQELKETLKLAVPVVISQVGNMSMGLIDSYAVGHVSSNELAAVAAGNSIYWSSAIIGIGLLFGMDPIVSQAFGRGDQKTCMKNLGQCLLLGLVLSALMIPLLLIIARNYHLTGTHPDIVHSAVPYIEIISFSFPFFFLFNAFQRYWQGLGIAIPVTIIVILANVANYFLDMALVRGDYGMPAMGARGVAYATLICRFLMLVAIIGMSYYLWHRSSKYVALRWRELWPFDWFLFRSFLRIGSPAAVQVALEVVAFNLTTLLIARLGPTELATHHIVLSIASFTFMFPLGLSSSTAVRVGFHLGGGSPQQTRQAGWLGIRLAVMIMMFFGMTLYLVPEHLIGFFSSDEKVLLTAMNIIILAAMFQVFDGLQVVSAGALRGLGDTKTALYSNLLSHYLVGLPLGLSLCFTFEYGLVGLWVGLAAGLFLVAMINVLFWYRKSRRLEPLIATLQAVRA